MRKLAVTGVLCLCVVGSGAAPRGEAHLQRLGEDIFAWRLQNQAFTYDDVDRLERPAQWLPDWSPEAIRKADETLASLQKRLKGIDAAAFGVPDRIDYLLLQSELERAVFERRELASLSRDPDFYVAQSAGVVYNYLVRPGPFDEARASSIVRQIERIPATLEAARRNLTKPIGPLAERAMTHLEGVEAKFAALVAALGPVFPAAQREPLRRAADAAARALIAYSGWLRAVRSSATPLTGIGKDRYDWLLRRLMMLPYTSDEVVAMAAQDWHRAEAFEAFETSRTPGLKDTPIVAGPAEQQRIAQEADRQVREFLVTKRILDVPVWMRHYGYVPRPEYLRVFPFGAPIFMISPSHLNQDFVRFVDPPRPDPSFWRRFDMSDPRPVVAHEGIPGHAFHLHMIERHDNPIRRRHYDGGVVEGVGTYVEEMLLQHGLLDDSPALRRATYRMLKLRALRVILDVNVASGVFSIEEGARFLSTAMPMDYGTAFEEANWAAATPGQNASYFAGKAAIVRLIALARRTEGERFDLHAFHNRLWQAGGVPMTLLRWEWFGQDDDVRRLGVLSPSVP